MTRTPGTPRVAQRSETGGSGPTRPSVRTRRLIDIDEVASLLGVTVRHVRRLVAERRIPYVKWGGLLRFDAAAVNAWVEDKTVAPAFGKVLPPHRARNRLRA